MLTLLWGPASKATCRHPHACMVELLDKGGRLGELSSCVEQHGTTDLGEPALDILGFRQVASEHPNMPVSNQDPPDQLVQLSFRWQQLLLSMMSATECCSRTALESLKPSKSERSVHADSPHVLKWEGASSGMKTVRYSMSTRRSVRRKGLTGCTHSLI